MAKILIKYRADRRIRVVEITTGSKKFLVGLQDFSDETGIRNFDDDDDRVGQVSINTEAYATLWGDRIQ